MRGGLYSVGVERDLSLAAQSSDLSDRLDRPDLVVGEHDRHQRSLICDGVGNVLDLHEALGVDRQIRNLDTLNFL